MNPREGLAVLPLIDSKLKKEYIGKYVLLMEYEEDKPEWNQNAVDFAALVAGHLYVHISELEKELEVLRNNNETHIP